MAHWEITESSVCIYRGKILNLHRDLVRLENGKTTAREVVEHHGGVAVLALDDQENVFFVRQFRYPFRAVLQELPAGKLELGEDPETCGRRELEEECGYRAEEFLPLGKLYPTCAYDTEVIHLFLARKLQPSRQHLDENEFLTVEKLPLEQAMELVFSGQLPDAKTQLALLKYQALRQQGRL